MNPFGTIHTRHLHGACWGRVAKTDGVKFCINPDTHAVNELSNVALGVNVARKAGSAAHDVVNTGSVADVKTMLRHTRT